MNRLIRIFLISFATALFACGVSGKETGKSMSEGDRIYYIEETDEYEGTSTMYLVKEYSVNEAKSQTIGKYGAENVYSVAMSRDGRYIFHATPWNGKCGVVILRREKTNEDFAVEETITFDSNIFPFNLVYDDWDHKLLVNYVKATDGPRGSRNGVNRFVAEIDMSNNKNTAAEKKSQDGLLIAVSRRFYYYYDDSGSIETVFLKRRARGSLGQSSIIFELPRDTHLWPIVLNGEEGCLVESVDYVDVNAEGPVKKSMYYFPFGNPASKPVLDEPKLVMSGYLKPTRVQAPDGDRLIVETDFPEDLTPPLAKPFKERKYTRKTLVLDLGNWEMDLLFEYTQDYVGWGGTGTIAWLSLASPFSENDDFTVNNVGLSFE
jgi:hypothetical protein